MTTTQKLLHSALDLIDAPTLIVGLDGKVQCVNEAAVNLLGGERSSFQGVGFDRVLAPERKAELRNLEDLKTGGGPRRLRTVARRADGSRLDVTISLAPLHDDFGNYSGVAVRFEARSGASASVRPSLPAMSEPLRSTLPPVPPPLHMAQTPVGPSPSRPAPKLSGTVAASPQAELLAKLHQMHSRLASLERTFSASAFDPLLGDPERHGNALRTVCELRALLDRALEVLEGPSSSGSGSASA